MSKYKELAKNTGIFAIANFSSKLLIFILVPIYTRTLSTADYGFYDLVYSTVQLLLPILTLNISEAVMRFLLKEDSPAEDVLLIALKYFLVGLSCFGTLLLLNKAFVFSELVNRYSFFIFLLFVFYSLNNLLVQFAKGIDRVYEMAVAGVIGTLAMVIFNLLFLLVFNIGLTGFFIANITCFLLPTVYLFIKLQLWGYKTSKIDQKLQKEMRAFSVPLILNTLGWWVNNTSDRYIVTLLLGVSSNGLISIAYKIPQILNTISIIFIQAWQISAIKEQDSDDNSFASTLFVGYNGVLSLIASLLILVVRPLSSFLFGNDFYLAWEFVPFLIISSLLNSAAGYIGAVLSADMKAKAMAKSATYGMIFNLIFNIVLGWWLGLQGITLATMISSYIIFEIRRRNTVNTFKADDYRLVQASWMLLVIQSVIVIYTDLWPVTLALVLFMVFLFRKILQSFIKTLLVQAKKLQKRKE